MRRARATSSTEFRTIAPLYWYLGPAIGLFPILLLIGGFGVVAGGDRSGDITLPLLAFIGTIGLVAALLFTTSRVVLAEGGLWIRHYFGAFKRFVPYADISLVDTVERLGKPGRSKFGDEKFIVFTAVRLMLKNGARVVIGASSEETSLPGKTSFSLGETGHYGTSDPVARQLAGAIRNRIREEENLPAPTPAEAVVMRGDRSPAEWHAALAKSTSVGGDAYRGDAATEGLWRIVEDEDAPRDARAGAAMALKRQLDADGKSRLRIIAGNCEPKLRVALDVALDETAEEEAEIAALERASDRRE